MPLQYATYLFHFDGCLAQCMLCGCDITRRGRNFKGTGWLSWFRACRFLDTTANFMR
ncbi:hypothetical protein BDW69DRAFT_168234 [Aspergillus filifer]